MKRGVHQTAVTTGFAMLVGLTVAVFSGASAIAAEERVPKTSPNLTLLAQRENPLLRGSSSHEFMNTDLAFSGDYAIQGNFDGFSVWDIKDPSNPTLTSAVECAGGQGDVSVAGNLVILSVDETMASDRCDAARVAENQNHWDGLRIFDISDPAHPVYVSSVQTRCGSHTNTLVPSGNSDSVLVYVSAYSRGPSTTCNGLNPLQIVSVPFAAPKTAKVVGQIDLFAGRDPYTPGDHVSGGADTRTTSGCHDITVFGNRAAAACRGDGLLLDISNPLKPRVLDQVRDKQMSFWHSAIFTNDGKHVIFQDEMGDGLINACTGATSSKRGADAIWSISGDKLSQAGYFKIPRSQADGRRCTSHNGNVVPVPDREILVQAWYEGGISLVDFSDASKPAEIGYAQWPSYPATHEFTAGIWSAYYYNGHIYASDMWSGLEVFGLKGPEFADAARYSATSLNPQNQPTYAWVWKTEPTIPQDRSSLPVLTLSVSAVIENDGTSKEDVAQRTISLSAPAGAFAASDTADIWLLPTKEKLATVETTDAGGLATTITLPSTIKPGSYDIVVRADQSADKPALGSVTVSARVHLAALIAEITGGLLILVILAWVLLRARLVRQRKRRQA